MPLKIKEINSFLPCTFPGVGINLSGRNRQAYCAYLRKSRANLKAGARGEKEPPAQT